MKTSRILLSALLALGAPTVALLAISNRVSVDVALAILSAAGLVAFAAFDYARNVAPLTARAEVLRPALPSHRVAPAPLCDVRRAA